MTMEIRLLFHWLFLALCSHQYIRRELDQRTVDKADDFMRVRSWFSLRQFCFSLICSVRTCVHVCLSRLFHVDVAVSDVWWRRDTITTTTVTTTALLLLLLLLPLLLVSCSDHASALLILLLTECALARQASSDDQNLDLRF